MTATFTVLPEALDPVNGGMSLFRIVGELVVKLTDPDTNSICYIHIPSGFETDFATVPRPFRFLIPPMGRYSWATVVHDYLLEEGYNAGFARRVLSVCMDDLGVKRWRKRIILSGVFFWDELGRPMKIALAKPK